MTSGDLKVCAWFLNIQRENDEAFDGLRSEGIEFLHGYAPSLCLGHPRHRCRVRAGSSAIVCMQYCFTSNGVWVEIDGRAYSSTFPVDLGSTVQEEHLRCFCWGSCVCGWRPDSRLGEILVFACMENIVSPNVVIAPKVVAMSNTCLSKT
jgi:hypothetical protein